MKKIILSIILAMSVTGFASTVSANNQNLVEQLLAQVRALQVQIANLQTQQPDGIFIQPDYFPNTNTSCVSLNYNLYFGLNDYTTNGDVTRLQNFLRTRPEASWPSGQAVTGFYGGLTEQSVQRFQSSNGIVSGGSPETTGYGSVGPKTREYIQKLTCNGSSSERISVSLGQTFNLKANNYADLNIEGVSVTFEKAPIYNCVVAPCYSPYPTFKFSGKGRLDQSVTFNQKGESKSVPGYDLNLTIVNYDWINGVATLKIERPSVSENNSSPVITSISGPTSLNVNSSGTWEINAYDNDNDPLTYSVDWGDIQYLPVSLYEVPVRTQQTTFTHTYNRVGNYTVFVTVSDGSNVTRSSITVNVTSNENSQEASLDFSASPSSGEAPLKVTFNVVAKNIPYCSQAFWDYGDGTIPPPAYLAPCIFYLSNQTRDYNYTATHTYNSPGTYTATLSYGVVEKSVTIKVGEAINQSPIVLLMDGPSSLNVGETGTWTIKARDPEARPLDFRMIWGDGNEKTERSTNASLDQKITINHRFSNSGSYTVRMYVTDEDGNSTFANLGYVEVSGTSYVAGSGDIAPRNNPNGTVDVGDAVLALRFKEGLETPTDLEIDAADINNNNKIDNEDVLNIMSRAVGLSGSIIMGDVDESGEVDVRDAVLISWHVNGTQSLENSRQEFLADITLNGVINENDISQTLNKAVGNEVEYD